MTPEREALLTAERERIAENRRINMRLKREKREQEAERMRETED